MRLHQPHPPGYLLYLWMGRALLPLAGDPHRALVWLSPLFAGLGTAVIATPVTTPHPSSPTLAGPSAVKTQPASRPRVPHSRPRTPARPHVGSAPRLATVPAPRATHAPAADPSSAQAPTTSPQQAVTAALHQRLLRAQVVKEHSPGERVLEADLCKPLFVRPCPGLARRAHPSAQQELRQAMTGAHQVLASVLHATHHVAEALG